MLEIHIYEMASNLGNGSLSSEAQRKGSPPRLQDDKNAGGMTALVSYLPFFVFFPLPTHQMQSHSHGNAFHITT